MDAITITPGDELKCPHCGRWHPIVAWHTEGTDYTVQMLYWQCAKGMYYAGQRGGASRHETRRLAIAAPKEGSV